MALDGTDIDTLAGEGFVQADRSLRLESSLGADALLAERLHYRAGINELFELAVQVRAKRQDIKPQELIGKLCDVSVEIGAGQRKYWNALVVGLSVGPPVTRGARSYTLTLRPSLWKLSQKSDWRVWQNLTSIDIAKQLLSEHGMPAPEVRSVLGQPKPWVYSVQAGETDLDFLRRRLEADGIFFYFAFEGGEKGSVSASHRLVLCDHQSGYAAPGNGEGQVRFSMGSADHNHINAWQQHFRYIPGKRTGADWSFLSPSNVPVADTSSNIEIEGNQNYELFEWKSISGYGTGDASGEIDSHAVERQSKWRMQAAEVDHELIEGASTCRTLEVGQKFTPHDVANPGNTFEEMVIFKQEVWAHDHSYETAGNDDPEYTNRFVALPARVPATPHRSTPRPRIEGSQIAIIAGPTNGEEVHTDSHGRAKVFFPWDRRAKKDGSDSCWIRVLQNWGGSSWGGQIIPRIGMEALVTYIDGDPDRPVISGLVPNAKQTVPYQLPDHKTKSVFRTNSYKSNDPTKFNELSFEDATGQENFHLHAQKDMTSKVLNNQIHTVDASALHSYGQQHQLTVGANMNHQVGGGLNQVVGATTGAGAAALLAPLAGLMGKSSDMLNMAMAIAGQAGGENGGTSSSGAGSEQSGSAPASIAEAIGTPASHIASLASSTLGAAPGGFDQAFGVLGSIAASTFSSLGGAPMASSGTAMLGTLGSLVQRGVRNQVVGSIDNRNVGGVSTEQIGAHKLSTVGQVAMEDVGHTKTIKVGEQFMIQCGASRLMMNKEGHVVIIGTQFHFEASGPVDIKGRVVDHNSPHTTSKA